jgi:hypothetical protein
LIVPVLGAGLDCHARQYKPDPKGLLFLTQVAVRAYARTAVSPGSKALGTAILNSLRAALVSSAILPGKFGHLTARCELLLLRLLSIGQGTYDHDGGYQRE